MHTIEQLHALIEAELSDLPLKKNPEQLYEPIRYMLSLGGKRLRPLLLLMSHELFNGTPKNALKPATAIEIFHNFTLLHDDIMDKAPLRRSKETVHKKWNSDIAILSGDSMFVLSCQMMMNVHAHHVDKVMNSFLKTALEVCEGQQLDMDFQQSVEVTIDDYLDMISRKTASLLGCSTFIGSICADASESDANHMYAFGKNLGIAFQLHDDILDVYGSPEKFGKQVGGDILSNKKTILLLNALEIAEGKEKTDLMQWMSNDNFDPQNKINAITDIYNKLHIKEASSDTVDFYFQSALKELAAVNTKPALKQPLMQLAEKMMRREN